MNSLSHISSPAASAPDRSRARSGWLSRAGTALGAAVKAATAVRAQREMPAFAERCESLQPQLAAELRAASAHLASR